MTRHAPARRTALEAGLPFEHLNPLAELESWRKEINRPIYHTHKWWANRLGSIFRAIVLAGNLPADRDVWDEFYKPHDFRDQIVLDPFMGSGTTLGESLKLGCRVVGCDINPVSYFQVRKALDWCDEADLRSAFARVEKRVASRVRALYRSRFEGDEIELLYTFWVKVVPCPDCGQRTRLFDRWIFAANAYPRRRPACRVLCRACGDVFDSDYNAESVSCPSCRERFDPHNGPARRGRFACEGCSKETKILDVVRELGRVPDHEMYALMLLLPDGSRVYKATDDDDRARYASAERSLKRRGLPIPKVEIPPGYNTDQARRYHYLYWHQMFNARQLLALGQILDGIRKEQDRNAREHLLLLFSGILEFNNMFCSFKGEGTGAVRHLFSHHILKPERTPLEAHPWGTPKSSGSFSTLFERRLIPARRYCARPFGLRQMAKNGRLVGEKISGFNQPIRPTLASRFEEIAEGTADALVLAGDSARLPIADESVDLVVTDPPYFDYVHYSELADFFYVWLRSAVSDDPAFQNDSTRSTSEVQARAADEFGRRLGGVFVEAARVLRSSGLLAFTFHHARDDGWIEVVRAIEKAGLEVVATHPIKAEMSVAQPKHQAKEPINLDLVVVCRHRGRDATRRFDVVRRSIEVGTDLVRRYNAAGIRLSRGDVRVVLMGGFLTAHSQAARPPTGFAETEAMIRSIAESIEALYGTQNVGPKQRREGPQRSLF